MSRTSVQKRNDRMDKIFENAKKNKIKYAGQNAICVLTRMNEKVKQVHTIQEKGWRVAESDWAELGKLTREADIVLESAILKG